MLKTRDIGVTQRRIPPEVYKDEGFLNAARAAVTEQLLGGNETRSIAEISTNDRRQINIIYKGVEYQIGFISLLQGISKNTEGTNGAAEARDLLAGKNVRQLIPPEVYKDEGFLNAARAAVTEQLLGGDETRSIAEISTNDNRQINITYNGIEYRVGFASFLQGISRNTEGINSKAEARDLLSGKNVRQHIPPETYKDEGFLDATRAAVTEHLLGGDETRSIAEISTNEDRQINIIYKGVEYQIGFIGLLRGISKNTEGINSIAEARDYLFLRSTGEAPANAIKIIAAGSVKEYVEDSYIGRVEAAGILSIISNLGLDHTRLSSYIRLAHPEIAEGEVTKIVRETFRGIYGFGVDREEKYLKYGVTLNSPQMGRELPSETKQTTIELEGTAEGATHLYIAGSWKRRIRVENGRFSTTIPLMLGEMNEFRIYAIDDIEKKRSMPLEFKVVQRGSTEDLSNLVTAISSMGSEALKNMRSDEGRYALLVRLLEDASIKRFCKSFDEGEAYLNNIAKNASDKVIKEAITDVLRNFKEINEREYPALAEGEELIFYQKYAIDRLVRKIEEGQSSILALEAGLGKTLIVLAALSAANKPGVIVVPNSVAESWDEQRVRFMPNDLMKRLSGLSSQKRKEEIGREILSRSARNGKHANLVVNREFLRMIDDSERFDLLNEVLQPNGILVIDEGHWTAIQGTNQSAGVSMLAPGVKIIVSATPYSNPERYRALISQIIDDERFQNAKAFREAFRSDDPESYMALYTIAGSHVIRLRKDDVLERYDPDVTLEAQGHRVPIERIMPIQEVTLTADQALSLYEMFTDWKGWSERNGHYMRVDGELWDGNSLIKKHAILQTINNPDYIGSQEQSPKHEEVRKVVEECVNEGRKVLIFTKYIHEANAYLEMFKEYNPAMLTGEISEKGELVNPDGSQKLFRYSQTKGFEFDERGYPIEDPEGRPMSALTYQRLTFMHSPERRVMISTYGTGGVGITLNAAKAVVLADPPETYTELYQALNRVERMDTPETRTHPDVRIYRIASIYPEEFIDLMKDTYIKRVDGRYEEVEKSEALEREGRLRKGYTTAYDEFFRQGTYDAFVYKRVENQSKISDMLLDGIVSEEETRGPEFQGA